MILHLYHTHEYMQDYNDIYFFQLLKYLQNIKKE